ncbi:MAG: hypothetical protein ACOZAP_04505 [Pseudomonadota bacterium]
MNVQSSLQAGWSIRAGASSHAVWDVTQASVVQLSPLTIHGAGKMALASRWSASWCIRIGRASVTPWSDAQKVRAANASSWGDVQRLRTVHAARWASRRAIRSSISLAWDVRATDPVRAELKSAWALPASARLQPVSNTPELAWNGRILRVQKARAHQDEGSPHWLAEIELARLEDYAAVAVGDAVRLAFGPLIFELVIDSKGLTRAVQDDGAPLIRLNLSAISPLALLDAPFAAALSLHRAEAVPARALVEELLGPVDWRLPDWTIPAGRALFDNATPLGLARRVVEAIGGLIESLPDGRVIARPRHEHGPLEHALTDGDILDLAERVAWERGFNRVTVSNEDGGTSSSDRLEAIRDENDPYRYRVRAWPAPWRIAPLWHSGHPDTRITALGERHDTETETLEFIEGQASLRYPAAAITGVRWQHADLGALTHEGARLTASTPGYSLCQVTYTTRVLAWDCALAQDEDVQFVLGD